MNKERFKKVFSTELKELSNKEMYDFINILIDDMPSKYYEYLLCKSCVKHND